MILGMAACIIIKGEQFIHEPVYDGGLGETVHCIFCQKTWPTRKDALEEIRIAKLPRQSEIEMLKARIKELEQELDRAYLAARGTSHLSDPSFTRSQMYWKGRADAAEDVRKLLKETH
jgi:hypothetical protein